MIKIVRSLHVIIRVVRARLNILIVFGGIVPGSMNLVFVSVVESSLIILGRTTLGELSGLIVYCEAILSRVC